MHWTNLKMIEDGDFKIDRTFADTKAIFHYVLDDYWSIRIGPKDNFRTYSGVTQKPLTGSDQHSITITHAYMVFLEKTCDVSTYDSQRSNPSMDLGVKWNLCVLFVQTAVNCQDCKFV